MWFGASAKHCAFYPGAIVQAFKDDLEDYDTSKGTIRFQADQPLPASLIRSLVKAGSQRTPAANGGSPLAPRTAAEHRRVGVSEVRRQYAEPASLSSLL